MSFVASATVYGIGSKRPWAHWELYELEDCLCLLPISSAKGCLYWDRRRRGFAVNLWFILILGVPAAVWGQSPDAAASQPAVAPAPPVSTAPSESPVSPPPSPLPEQFDEYLRLITGTNEPDVRLMGARRLLETGHEEAARRLVSVLEANPPDLAAQIAVCKAISDSEGPMPSLVKPLMLLLGSQQPDLNEVVTQALRQFDDGGVVDHLGHLACDATAAIERREAAVGVLGEMGDNAKAVSALTKLLQNGPGRVRQAALAAFEHATGVEHADAASASAWWERHKSAPPLEWARSVNERRAARNRRLQNQTRHLTRRLVAAYRESYVRTPEPVRPKKLLEFLGDDLPEVRALGLDLINILITDRNQVGQEIKARLVEMIADPDSSVRASVAVMVGDLRLTEAVPKLAEVLGRESDHRARAAEISAIGRLDGVAATEVVIRSLDDETPAVVAEAALALAAISRRAQEAPEVAKRVATALLARFKEVSVEDVELREKFIEAMAQSGDVSFRAVFRAEIGPDRSLRIRRAAIAGLGAHGDSAAANDVRPMITDSQPTIRQAAVQAMGQCGRQREDLVALASRLDSTSEADQTVRERAWESYLEVAQRLPPKDLLTVSDPFARKGDKVAQHRRIELLKLITRTPQRLKQLSVSDQVGVFERMGDAQVELSDYAVAASSFDRAIALVPDRGCAEFASLAARLVGSLLQSRQDQAAVQRIGELANGEESNGGSFDSVPLIETVLTEARARIDAAADAAAFADAIKLIELVSEPAARIGSDFTRQLAGARAEADTKRQASIDRLLSAMVTDPQAEVRLLAYGKDLVLPRLHAKLTGIPTTSAPANGIEGEWIKLAKRFVGQWPGYTPGCPADERAKALEMLKATWAPPRPEPGAPVTTAPSPASSS
ncbi:MAG: HEAT repeat domain-containing protein [Phycisphaerae bacterium]|nr:HEAT repeat domain-containing protein [Phycisphaerae bacterium]